MKKVLFARLITDRPVTEPVSMFRGYIGKKFPEHELLHNHQEKGYTYRYPLVQFKILEGTPVILGIEAGADILMKILPEIENLQLVHNHYKVIDTNINIKQYKIQPTNIQKSYKFVTPWLGLNQKNYKKYIQIDDWKERKALLNGILIGNILSMCTRMDIRLKEKLELHSHFDATSASHKGVIYHSFIGNFRVNFDLPDFFGLGKGVSHGFGVVLSVKSEITV